MRHVILTLVAVIALMTAGCPEENQNSSSHNGARLSAKLPQEQVADIVNAVQNKELEKVTALLKSNPQLVHAQFQQGGPVSGWPLIMIAATEGDLPMVELLIQSGANVNEPNFSSEVALHYAAYKGHAAIVKKLLEHKAQVNVTNDADATPLSLAQRAGQMEIIGLLKQHGAQ